MKSAKKRRLKKINYLKRKYKRIINRKRRKIKVEYNSNKRIKTRPPRIIIANKLLTFLSNRNFISEKIKIKRKAHIEIPKIFSFTENPNETIQTLKKLVALGLDPYINHIHIDHSQCKELGLGASTVMDVILMEIKNYRKKIKSRNFSLGGKLPKSGSSVRDILEVSGLLKHLEFKLPERKEFELLQLIDSGSAGYVSERVIEYVKNCLTSQGLTLARDGMQTLGEIVGEVVGNCSHHSGSFKKWYTIGHFYSNEENRFGEFHLVIFNFGNTIYESLQHPDENYMIKNFLRMTERHKKYFIPGKWDEESLWTLYALQDGVSRKRSKSDPTRGSGTIRLIEGFREIGTKQPDLPEKMSITSGHINIYFDKDSQLKIKNYGDKERKIIAFNKSNDIYLPADEKNIRILENFFPGTIISMKLYIKNEYLVKILEDSNNDN